MGRTIAEIMRELLLSRGRIAVMWGDADLLDECAARVGSAGRADLTPVEKRKRILDALEESPLFEKSLLENHEDHRKVRAFQLIESARDVQKEIDWSAPKKKSAKQKKKKRRN